MAVIVPAILPRSHDDLVDKLLRLEGIASEVQIDIVDGKFATPASWPFLHAGESAHTSSDDPLPFLGLMRFEMDIMTEAPDTQVGRWIQAGAGRITIHAESTQGLAKLLETFRTQYGHDASFAPGLLSVGLAINLATDTSLIEPFLSQCDYVQFMGIREIGKQGEPFDKAVLLKIAAFRRKHPDMPIQVDGGVSLSTASALLSAGVSRLIVGSALWKAQDLKSAYGQFQDLTTRYGLYT